MIEEAKLEVELRAEHKAWIAEEARLEVEHKIELKLELKVWISKRGKKNCRRSTMTS